MGVSLLQVLRVPRVVSVTPFRLVVSFFMATVLISSSVHATLPGEWEGFGGPIGWDGPVSVMIKDGENLVIGGEFSRVDWTDHRYIVMRDSTRYRLLGEGLPGPVYALLSTTGGLVAGGWWLGELPLAYSSFVSLWDGTEWQRMSDGFNNRVNALVEYEGEVIAGGLFTRAGPTSLGGIARWDGEDWFPLGGAGFDGGGVNALLVYDGALIAAGEFTEVDGIPAAGLAVWDGVSWSAFPGGGIGNESWVQTLAIFGDDLVAGGSFQTIGGAGIPYIATWDGATWNFLGVGVNGQVRTLAVHGADLAVGGVFNEAGGVPAGNVALWNGSSWSNLAGGADAEVSTLISHDGKLFAGGWFHSVGGDSLVNFAFWDGASWGTFAVPDLPGGTDGTVRSVLETPDGIVAAGDFTIAGSTAVQNAARLVNGEWEAMGTALGGMVWDLYSFHDSIFAAGTGFGGVRVWDEALGDWASVGNNLNQTVACLGEFDGHLVAGGNFTRTGQGDTVCYGARLEGGEWIRLGYLVGGTVRALLEWEGSLIAAGDITEDTSSGTPLERVARWDGAQWHSMGSGMDDQVHSLTVFDGAVIAGGWFDVAGGEPASKIARWDGEAWGPFTDRAIGGTGIYTVGVYNGELYAGGSSFVRWAGSIWEAPYGGVGGVVYDMQVVTSFDSPALLVGGGFSQAGPVWTNDLALWRTEEISTSVAIGVLTPIATRALLGPNRPNPFNPSTAIDYLIPEAATVSLTIHDIGGRLVARLISGHELAGRHTVIWDGRSNAGRPVSSGVYFMKLRVGDRAEVRKITLVR